MGNVRSKGVVFFAWSFIILNLLTLIFIRSYGEFSTFVSKYALIAMIGYAVVFSLIGIVVSFNTLRLKGWARKAMIILAILGILDMVVFVPLGHSVISRLPPSIDTQILEKQYNSLTIDAKTRLGISSKEEFVMWAHQIGIVAGHVFVGIVELLLLIYSICMLIFFTRPKVKEQFK